jgi:hypothetical protein
VRDISCGIPPAGTDRRVADGAFHSARATSACDEELGGLGAGGGGVAPVRARNFVSPESLLPRGCVCVVSSACIHAYVFSVAFLFDQVGLRRASFALLQLMNLYIFKGASAIRGSTDDVPVYVVLEKPNRSSFTVYMYIYAWNAHSV